MATLSESLGIISKGLDKASEQRRDEMQFALGMMQMEESRIRYEEGKADIKLEREERRQTRLADEEYRAQQFEFQAGVTEAQLESAAAGERLEEERMALLAVKTGLEWSNLENEKNQMRLSSALVGAATPTNFDLESDDIKDITKYFTKKGVGESVAGIIANAVFHQYSGTDVGPSVSRDVLRTLSDAVSEEWYSSLTDVEGGIEGMSPDAIKAYVHLPIIGDLIKAGIVSDPTKVSVERFKNSMAPFLQMTAATSVGRNISNEMSEIAQRDYKIQTTIKSPSRGELFQREVWTMSEEEREKAMAQLAEAATKRAAEVITIYNLQTGQTKQIMRVGATRLISDSPEMWSLTDPQVDPDKDDDDSKFLRESEEKMTEINNKIIKLTAAGVNWDHPKIFSLKTDANKIRVRKNKILRERGLSVIEEEYEKTLETAADELGMTLEELSAMISERRVPSPWERGRIQSPGRMY